MIKYGPTITTEKVKFRLNQVKIKLDTEQKVKAGSENLIHALSRNPGTYTIQKKSIFDYEINLNVNI
jgi:hypothetical protein